MWGRHRKKMRILIAINENEGIDSKLSEHFGHCPYFAIYDKEKKEIEIVENKIEHNNPNITPVDQVMKFNPDSVFTLGIGGRAIGLFNKKNVDLRTGEYKVVKEVIENIDNLKKLNSGCEH